MQIKIPEEDLLNSKLSIDSKSSSSSSSSFELGKYENILKLAAVSRTETSSTNSKKNNNNNSLKSDKP